MGRLLSPSKPKAVKPQVVYYTPAPAAVPKTPAGGGSSTPETDVEAEKTPQEVEAERAETLLRRNRSRLGTVLTSFRGVLSQNDLSASRKTLLGE